MDQGAGQLISCIEKGGRQRFGYINISHTLNLYASNTNISTFPKVKESIFRPSLSYFACLFLLALPCVILGLPLYTLSDVRFRSQQRSSKRPLMSQDVVTYLSVVTVWFSIVTGQNNNNQV